MVRISVDIVNNAYQFINPVKQRELSLRNLQIPVIENLGVTNDQFDLIDLSDNNIRKLDNLPLLKRLETLFFHNNRIQFIQKDIAAYLPQLRTLILTNNNLNELGDIDSLAKCANLEYLSLLGNPIVNKNHYREYIIYKLKQVRVLDYKRIKQMERVAAKKLFKGSIGEALRREIVCESEPVIEEEEQANGEASHREIVREPEPIPEKKEQTTSNGETLHCEIPPELEPVVDKEEQVSIVSGV